MIKSLFFLLLLPNVPYCQALTFAGKDNFLGAGSLSRRFVDVFATAKNPACLGELESTAIAVVNERKYMLKELNFFSFDGALRFLNSGVGVAFSFFGNPDYHEWMSGISYGIKCSSKMLLGVSFGFNRREALGYEPVGAIQARAGYLLYLTEKLKSSLEIDYRSSGGLGSSLDCSSGLGYEISEKFLVAMQVLKRQSHPVSLNAILHYAISEDIFLRTSLFVLEGNSCFGVGYKWKGLSTTLATSYHRQLGVSPMLSLLFQKPKSKGEE